MLRNEFLRKSLGMIVLSPLMIAYTKDPLGGNEGSVTTVNGSENGSSSSNCTLTASETAGPFPTKTPGSLVAKDIRSDRPGIAMAANITVKNKNANCAVLEGAMVDIWHCDADGNYSEYGGIGMQSQNYTGVHFLRGRQTTDANGQVSFITIFPGWYSGRAVHIHVHIYDAFGKSLLVTQIAFPASVCDTVFTSATDKYKKGKADTTNERDNVFRDGYANELASLSGSVGAGYILSHSIVVNA